jgi:hypothetical protein
MVGIVKHVRRGLVNGDGARLGGRVNFLAAMNGQSRKVPLLFGVFVL